MKRTLLVSLFLIFVAGPAQAALIGLTLEEPLINYDSGGTTSYDAATDVFTVDATSFDILLGGPPPTQILNGTFDISIQVDDTGSVVGGVPGDDLLITGDLGAGLVVLLTGEILAFGFQDQQGQDPDFFEFLFKATGGTLVADLPTDLVGVELTSENSSFGGSFTVDFAGAAKGTAGAVIPEPTGFIVFAIGAMVAGGAAVTRRRAA
jgi:hypothetical protein